jgi:hypothetical protein
LPVLAAGELLLRNSVRATGSERRASRDEAPPVQRRKIETIPANRSENFHAALTMSRAPLTSGVSAFSRPPGSDK